MKPETKSKVKKTASKAVQSTAKAAEKTGSYITKNPKTVLYIGLGVLTIYLGYKVYKGINAVGHVFVDDTKEGGGDVGKVNNPSTVPTGATINSVQAHAIAANILSAVDGLGGLNEKEYKTVETALKGKTPRDFQMISEAFGHPKRSPVTGEQSFWFFGERLNLMQWLNVEMNDSQKARLKAAAPLIF